MASYTTNYGLYKPNSNDDIVVDTSLTDNFTKIDTEIKNRQSETGDNANDISNLQTDVSTNTTDISNLQTDVSNNSGDIGTLGNLNTTDQSNLVASINELDGNTDANATDISTLDGRVGTLSNLATADQSSLVNAINEVNGKFIEINKGVFTTSGDGTATTATILHGLSSAPAFYQVQEGSADAGAADISHVTVDATNITVTFKTAPVSGTDNVSLVWRAEL